MNSPWGPMAYASSYTKAHRPVNGGRRGLKNSKAAMTPHISAIPMNPKTRASHLRGVAPREKPGNVLFAMRRLSHAMNARSRTNAMRTTRTATMTFAALNE
jgi:hypothetical protein